VENDTLASACNKSIEKKPRRKSFGAKRMKKGHRYWGGNIDELENGQKVATEGHGQRDQVGNAGSRTLIKGRRGGPYWSA